MTVVEFPGGKGKPPEDDLPDNTVADVLGVAALRNLEDVLVLGRRQDGDFWFSTNRGDVGDMLFLVEIFKHIVLRDSLGAER